MRVAEGNRTIERGRHRLLSTRVGSRTPGKIQRERDRERNKKRAVGADIGSRIDEEGAGGGHMTEGEEVGVCIHRVEGGEGPAREFPAFAQLILIPPQQTPSF